MKVLTKLATKQHIIIRQSDFTTKQHKLQISSMWYTLKTWSYLVFYFVTLTSLLVCFIRHLPPLGFFYLFILKCTISHDYPIASLFFPNEVIHWKPLTHKWSNWRTEFHQNMHKKQHTYLCCERPIQALQLPFTTLFNENYEGEVGES